MVVRPRLSETQACLHAQRLTASPDLIRGCLSRQGPGSNDCTASERALNVATSLPFLAVGFCTCRCAPCHLPSAPAVSFKAHCARWCTSAKDCFRKHCLQPRVHRPVLESHLVCTLLSVKQYQQASQACTHILHASETSDHEGACMPGAARPLRGASSGHG